MPCILSYCFASFLVLSHICNASPSIFIKILFIHQGIPTCNLLGVSKDFLINCIFPICPGYENLTNKTKSKCGGQHIENLAVALLIEKSWGLNSVRGSNRPDIQATAESRPPHSPGPEQCFSSVPAGQSPRDLLLSVAAHSQEKEGLRQILHRKETLDWGKRLPQFHHLWLRTDTSFLLPSSSQTDPLLSSNVTIIYCLD